MPLYIDIACCSITGVAHLTLPVWPPNPRESAVPDQAVSDQHGPWFVAWSVENTGPDFSLPTSVQSLYHCQLIFLVVSEGQVR